MNALPATVQHLPPTRIKFGPDRYEFTQMVRSKDRRISRQVVEVVHDDGNKQVQHDERTKKNEGYKVDVG